MSEKKEAGGGGRSSFSFTSDLFGIRDDHHTSSSSMASSNHIFASIFSKGSGQHSEVGGKSQLFSSSPKTEGNSKGEEWKNQSTSSREMSSSFCQEQIIAHPSHFSSSIYYGGQDVYTQNQNPETTGFNTSVTLKKDEGDDDSGGASRGNWWQGSLYY